MIYFFESSRADRAPLEVVKNSLGYGKWISVGEDFVFPHNRYRRAFEIVYRDSFDVLVVLGDRYETLAAVSAAVMRRKKVVHLHGGEISRGSFDDSFRNSITHMAGVHCVATERAFDRVMCLAGPLNVHLTGAPGLDAIKDLPERRPNKTIILTYHPETRGDDSDFKPMMDCLRRLVGDGYRIIWTGPNYDPDPSGVRDFLNANFTPARMSHRDNILACRQADFVIGNSSSGIIECPTIGVPSIDVGTRQDGRERGPSVIKFDGFASIKEALLYSGPFDNPYYQPEASKAVANILRSL